MNDIQIRKLKRLINEFANLQFDCGEWEEGGSLTYNELSRKSDRTELQLVNYIKSIMENK